MSFTVIIPSKTASNLVPCIDALRAAEPAGDVIVVDDGVEWTEIGPKSSQQARWLAASAFRSTVMMGYEVIRAPKPFIFARNCNLGIKACSDDVILLNDDAMLETFYGFHELEQASLARPEYGIISAATNVAGNLNQRRREQGKGDGLREEKNDIAFICIYIPRSTIDKVGLLDERFTAYGWEDNDYCRRVRNAGLKIAVLDDCYVDHGSLKSTFRGEPRTPADISAGREIFRQKWGDVPR